MSSSGDITALLHRWNTGDRGAEDELFLLVMPELRRIAHYLMKSERKGHTLQPTELVDQVYLRLVDARSRDWQNRRHFFAIAARAMRRHLIDYARGRHGEMVDFEGIESLLPADSEKLHIAVTVDALLEELASVNQDWCTVVEAKFFLGLSDEEASEALGIKLRTLQRMWLEARKWLFGRMEPGKPAEEGQSREEAM